MECKSSCVFLFFFSYLYTKCTHMGYQLWPSFYDNTAHPSRYLPIGQPIYSLTQRNNELNGPLSIMGTNLINIDWFGPRISSDCRKTRLYEFGETLPGIGRCLCLQILRCSTTTCLPLGLTHSFHQTSPRRSKLDPSDYTPRWLTLRGHMSINDK